MWDKKHVSSFWNDWEENLINSTCFSPSPEIYIDIQYKNQYFEQLCDYDLYLRMFSAKADANVV